jgi:hypothetical protein
MVEGLVALKRSLDEQMETLRTERADFLSILNHKKKLDKRWKKH